MSMVFCRGCGKQIHVSAAACPECGAPQQVAQAMAPRGNKSKTTAALWAFFLGGVGAHKFYLGQTGLGFLYLIFFWTFIPAIIAFIEFIMYLAMSDATFNQKYNS